MAKNGFGKFLTGVAVIGAGVALGLAIYNKFDTIKRELNDDEFEDDLNDEEGDDDSQENSYVTINTSSESFNDPEENDSSEESKEDSEEA
ncbi:MAG: hypothetical protein PUF12_11205 [Thermoflexaceae bacterium]|nr:hypothetical protein [Thermoflexaceae bacterium]